MPKEITRDGDPGTIDPPDLKAPDQKTNLSLSDERSGTEPGTIDPPDNN